MVRDGDDVHIFDSLAGDHAYGGVERVIKKKVGVEYPGTKLWNYALLKNLILTNWRRHTTLDPVIKLKNPPPGR